LRIGGKEENSIFFCPWKVKVRFTQGKPIEGEFKPKPVCRGRKGWFATRGGRIEKGGEVTGQGQKIDGKSRTRHHSSKGERSLPTPG